MRIEDRAVISALRRLMYNGCYEFEASLAYMVSVRQTITA